MRRYEIYALVDPFTSDIFYVGSAGNSQQRLYNHISEAKTLQNAKCVHIRSIVSQGGKPLRIILDSVETYYPELVKEMENIWIIQMQRQGHQLLNGRRAHTNFSVRDGYDALAEIPFLKSIAMLPFDEMTKKRQEFTEHKRMEILRTVYFPIFGEMAREVKREYEIGIDDDARR